MLFAVVLGALVNLAPSTAEVVVGGQLVGSVAEFAGQELTNFLSRAFGSEVALSRRPTPGKVSLILGDCAEARSAGIDVRKLPTDGYVIRVAPPDRIYIAGVDDTSFVPGKSRHVARGTLFGAYGFLERFIGCRFYFPGELGEIVPRCESVKVPEGEICRSPDFLVRQIPNRHGAWYEEISEEQKKRLELLFYYRIGAQTVYIPCCHGQAESSFVERFGKTHPEYFQMRPDGTRAVPSLVDGKVPRYVQMCHSSGIWDEIYKDAKAYFQRLKASERGFPDGRWGGNARDGRYYDIMPEDGMTRCACEKCRAAYARAARPDDWAGELIWGRVADIGNRLISEGIPGMLTMMSYVNYKHVPSVTLPTNVAVMVCSNDPWFTERSAGKSFDNLLAWREKCGKVWLWNNNGKHRWYRLNLADVPTSTPHAFGRYYRKCAPYVFGAYASNESERFLYSALNEYVFCKVAWDRSADPEAIIDEYYRLMFGAASGPMKLFFDELERKWLTEVIGESYDIPYGTAIDAPLEFTVWTKLYAPERLKPLETLFLAAEQMVPKDSLEFRRISLMRREFLQPMVRHARNYALRVSAVNERKRRASRVVKSLLPSFGSVTLSDAKDGSDRLLAEKTYDIPLVPGRKYRLSFIVKGENLLRKPQTRLFGFTCRVLANAKGTQTLAKTDDLEGTFDEVHQAVEFTVPENPGSDFSPVLALRLEKVSGKAVVSDLIFEDMTDWDRGVFNSLEDLPIACETARPVDGRAESLLPKGRSFKLVWHDEFDGARLDESKWSYRTNFWGRAAHWFAKPEDNSVEVKDGLLKMKLVKRPDGQFVSPQLQTGELVWDVSASDDTSTFWPLVKRKPAKFEHRYGYYECRCRLQQLPGWWSAFWMQTEMQGTSLDPARSGIEHDIMESFEPGEIIPACFHYNGYGDDHLQFEIPEPVDGVRMNLKLDKTQFHVFGLLWDENGYSVYVDGRLRGSCSRAVSRIPEFLLLTTEAKWYRVRRMTGSPVPELEEAVAQGDEFQVDYVRVFDLE